MLVLYVGSEASGRNMDKIPVGGRLDAKGKVPALGRRMDTTNGKIPAKGKVPAKRKVLESFVEKRCLG